MRRAPRPSPFPDHVVHAGATCPDCGKVRYQSRRDAKKAMRAANIRGLNEYQCGDFWHAGHLPSATKRGTLPRSDIQ